jgi:hypothetical protein
MRREEVPVKSLIPVSLVLCVSACSSSYHPEYHPVSVSNISQNLAYPAASNAAGERAQVYLVPAAPAPVVMVPEAPPPDFFK